ncbi:hypothetical protein HD806DRAFT_551390 [Xylariaceae sp. AK1471]|nr:hypothetical protein HD806DRAFT_551390 [Xylariaceae sp. AK1471]
MAGFGGDLLPSGEVGAVLICLFMSMNAGLFAVYSRPATAEDHFSTNAISMTIRGPSAKAVIASTYLFMASYAPTWGRDSWTYPPELHPLRVRGKAVALATYFTPVAFATITWKTYMLFAVFCAFMFINCFLLFPETADRPLEEVAAIFEDTDQGLIKYIGIPA